MFPKKNPGPFFLSISILVMVIMVILDLSAVGEESPRIRFLSPPVKVRVDGKIYSLGWTEGIYSGATEKQNQKFLVALDSKGDLVQDPKVLGKIFFVEYVYRPVFDRPGEFIGPTDIGGYRKLDEYRLMQQLADVTLFVREAGVRALVQAGKVYITGGTSAGAAVGEKIAEKTAEHLIKSILTNPAMYLKARESLVFEDAASRWKRAEALFLKTKGNNVLRYEDAKKIHDDLSFGRAYGTGSMMFLAKLTLKEGGGGDLLSQLQKVGEYAFNEFVAEVKGLYKQKDLVTTTMLGYKLETFLLSKAPLYGEYVESTKGFYKELNEFYRKYYLPEHIERNLQYAKLKEKATQEGGFSINTDPSEARIFINGRLVGASPYVGTGFPAGSYQVRILKEGYEVWQKNVSVEAGKTAEIIAKLKEEHPGPKAGDVLKDHLAGMEFVFVKGGCFEMGDTIGDGEEHEKPVHQVCLDDFYIGKCEVTIGQFRDFVDNTGYKTEADGGGGCFYWTGNKFEAGADKNWRNPGFPQREDHPVVCVSYNDAIAYVTWLKSKSHKGYRLPTEAEWEYAARSGGRKDKWGGTSRESELDGYAWYSNNSDAKTHPVGHKRPNGLGLYDMSGNVNEWCQDWYELHAHNIRITHL